MPKTKQLIGMTDLVDFPDLGLFDVQAKIDTGAYTSALHCKKVRVMKSEGRTILRFQLVDKTGKKPQLFYSSDFSQRMIRNSFGVAEMRYVIQTHVLLFGRSIRTEFTLADREKLKNPVLLGRKLLRTRFIVDVTLKNVSYQQKISRQTSAELFKEL